MRNPLWRLKALPWPTLLLAAGLAVVIATAVDILLGFGLTWLLSHLGAQFLPLFSVLLLVLPLAAGFGLGALAIGVMERGFPQIDLNAGVLWALLACVALVLWFKGFLPIPQMLVTLGYGQLVGTMLGIFWVGKTHWR